MMKRFIAILIGLLYFVVAVYSQQQGKAVLRFDNTCWDFGRISETGGKVSHTFHFTNIYNFPLVIEKVISTCGCTVPVYSKQPIKPGMMGTITVTFDPKGRTSYFSKSIRIVSNAGQSVNTLWIKGTINTADKIEDQYPYFLSSDIRADKLTLSYGQLQHNGEPKQLEIKLYNCSDRNVNMSYSLLDKSGCLSISMPSSLQARSYATIKILASPLKGFYGTLNDKIVIRINSVKSPLIKVFGFVTDDMRGVSMVTAPCMECSQSYFKLGNIPLKKRIQRKVKIANKGRGLLIIHKVECPMFISTNIREEKVLRQGESLEVVFDLDISYFKRNSWDTKVKIVTNDIQKPIYTVVFESGVGN